MEEIRLDCPVIVTLSPNAVAVIMDALAELPFKKSNVVIQELISQIKIFNATKSVNGDELRS